MRTKAHVGNLSRKDTLFLYSTQLLQMGRSLLLYRTVVECSVIYYDHSQPNKVLET